MDPLELAVAVETKILYRFPCPLSPLQCVSAYLAIHYIMDMAYSQGVSKTLQFIQR
jgi:hypothetical protein